MSCYENSVYNVSVVRTAEDSSTTRENETSSLAPPENQLEKTGSVNYGSKFYEDEGHDFGGSVSNLSKDEESDF